MHGGSGSGSGSRNQRRTVGSDKEIIKDIALANVFQCLSNLLKQIKNLYRAVSNVSEIVGANAPIFFVHRVKVKSMWVIIS